LGGVHPTDFDAVTGKKNMSRVENNYMSKGMIIMMMNTAITRMIMTKMTMI
jgi:hypothetical protein